MQNVICCFEIVQRKATLDRKGVKMKFIVLLAIVVVYATVASAEPGRPRPQQVPPRPPHPRLRREADPESLSIETKPSLHPRLRREADPRVSNPAHTYPTPRPPRFVREADPGVNPIYNKPTPHPRRDARSADPGVNPTNSKPTPHPRLRRDVMISEDGEGVLPYVWHES